MDEEVLDFLKANKLDGKSQELSNQGVTHLDDLQDLDKDILTYCGYTPLEVNRFLRKRPSSLNPTMQQEISPKSLALFLDSRWRLLDAHFSGKLGQPPGSKVTVENFHQVPPGVILDCGFIPEEINRMSRRQDSGPSEAHSSQVDEAVEFVMFELERTKDFPGLVKALQGDDRDTQARAAEALKFLSSPKFEHRPDIVEAGAITPLVRLLGCSGPRPGAKASAAAALSNLVMNDLQVAVAQAGAIRPLVRMLITGSADGRQQAVIALTGVMFNNAANRVEVAEAGAVPMLVQYLTQSSSSEEKKAVLKALMQLACDNVENKVALAKAGAIPPMAEMLTSSGDAEEKKIAAAALFNLAGDKVVAAEIQRDFGYSRADLDRLS